MSSPGKWMLSHWPFIFSPHTFECSVQIVRLGAVERWKIQSYFFFKAIFNVVMGETETDLRIIAR